MSIKTRLLKLEEKQAAKNVTREPTKEWLADLIRSIKEEKEEEAHLQPKAPLSIFDGCQTLFDVVKAKQREGNRVA